MFSGITVPKRAFGLRRMVWIEQGRLPLRRYGIRGSTYLYYFPFLRRHGLGFSLFFEP